MLTVIAQSVNGSESPVTESFHTVAEVIAYVPGAFRGLSSQYAVKIMRDGVLVGRGYRSEPNGTGESWTWEAVKG